MARVQERARERARERVRTVARTRERVRERVRTVARTRERVRERRRTVARARHRACGRVRRCVPAGTFIAALKRAQRKWERVRVRATTPAQSHPGGFVPTRAVSPALPSK